MQTAINLFVVLALSIVMFLLAMIVRKIVREEEKAKALELMAKADSLLKDAKKIRSRLVRAKNKKAKEKELFDSIDSPETEIVRIEVPAESVPAKRAYKKRVKKEETIEVEDKRKRPRNGWEKRRMSKSQKAVWDAMTPAQKAERKRKMKEGLARMVRNRKIEKEMKEGGLSHAEAVRKLLKNPSFHS
jgi:hypothetical protein